MPGVVLKVPQIILFSLCFLHLPWKTGAFKTVNLHLLYLHPTPTPRIGSQGNSKVLALPRLWRWEEFLAKHGAAVSTGPPGKRRLWRWFLVELGLYSQPTSPGWLSGGPDYHVCVNLSESVCVESRRGQPSWKDPIYYRCSCFTEIACAVWPWLSFSSPHHLASSNGKKSNCMKSVCVSVW